MELTKITKEALEDLYLKKRLSMLEVGKVLKVSDHTARRWLRKFEIPIRTISETSTKYPKTSFSGDLVEKAYILGLRTGDLYATPHRKLIRVEAGSSQLIFLKMFKKIFSRYSVVKVYETKSKITEKSFKVYCYLDSSFDFLIKKLEEIPEWIMKTDEYFFSFLAGYIDAEGSWIIAKHKIKKWMYEDSVFTLGCCDKIIMQQIHQKLKELGFNSHLYLDRKAGTSTQLGKYYSDFYRIRIYGKDVARLAKIIFPLSNHEDKQKRIMKIIELEKMKEIKAKDLGTIEIPCLYCGYKKVSKYGGYSYKGKQHQSYECPACIKVFTELTSEKIQKKDTEKIENLFHRGVY
jgi:hypothetical protein